MAHQVRLIQPAYRNERPEEKEYNLQDPLERHGIPRLILQGVPGLSSAPVEALAPAPLQRPSPLFSPPGNSFHAIQEPTYIPLGAQEALSMQQILEGLMAMHQELQLPAVIDDSTPALIREMVAEPLFARTWVSKWHAFFETIGGDLHAEKLAIAQFLFHLIIPIYKRSDAQDQGRLEKYAQSCYTIIQRLFPEENVKQLIGESQILLTEAERVTTAYTRYSAFNAAEQAALKEIVHAAAFRLRDGYIKIRRSIEAELQEDRVNDMRMSEMATRISEGSLGRRELVAFVAQFQEAAPEESRASEAAPVENPKKLLFDIARMLDLGRDVGEELLQETLLQRQEQQLQLRAIVLQVRTLQAQIEREGQLLQESLIIARGKNLERNQLLLQRRQQTLEECRQAQVELLAAIDHDHTQISVYQRQLESLQSQLNTLEQQLRS